jgi:hypothetical protein
MSKFLNILLIGLFIIVIIGLFYLAIPKYQVDMIRLDDETVMVTKINTLTGKTETYYRGGKKAKEIYKYIEGIGNKGAIQEDIRAKSIIIVNDEGQEVIRLGSFQEGNGIIGITDKAGTTVASMGAGKDGGRISITNKAGTPVVDMVANEKDNGEIRVFNNSGKEIGSLP